MQCNKIKNSRIGILLKHNVHVLYEDEKQNFSQFFVSLLDN